MNKMTTLETLFAIFILTFLINSNYALANFSGGDGSAANPYKISDVNDWQQLMTTTNDNINDRINKYFILTADLNLAGIDVIPIHMASSKFDGNNHVIRNVTINRPNDQYVGLFGFLNGGEIKNLCVEDINIIGCDYVGGLAGCSSASIYNCHTSGSVRATPSSEQVSFVGGLIGQNRLNNKSIDNCFSTCTVYCSATYVYAGGLIGDNESSVSNCYATGEVYSPSGDVSIGGLIGSSGSGQIEACYAIGSVSAPSSSGGYCGGLIGDSWGQVSNCYARGPVSANVGYVGGLTGRADMITNCYSTGLVTASTNAVGGLAVMGDITDSFWDIQTSGQTKGRGTGLTTAEMKMLSTFKQANWDFINTWAIGEKQTYPYLRQTPASDINQDKKVDYFDLAVLAENWLTNVD